MNARPSLSAMSCIGDDPWVTEPRRRSGLAPEPGEEPPIRGQLGTQHLDRDRAVQVVVGGLVHLAHPAAPRSARIS